MSLYKPKGSDNWWVSLSHPDSPRVRRTTGTADEKEAQRIHDEWKAQLWRQPAIKGKSWGQAVILWATVQERSSSDIQSLAKFGLHYKDRALSQVTVENLVDALAFCKTPATYMRYRGRIMAVLNLAAKHEWIRDVPKLPVRRVPKTSRMWLTHDQWDALKAALPVHQQRMASFSLETGLRQENVLSLRWSQVDLERRVVWHEAEEMKGDKAKATPLTDEAIAVLLECKDEHPEFVFTYKGHPVTEIKTAFQRACVAAGVGSFRSGRYEGFTWHGLRHTWATWHMQNGTPIEVLKELGAWADLRMVSNYAHHAPSHLAGFAANHRRKK